MTASAQPIIPVGIYHADPVHSTIGFAVKHMALATVRGRFHKFTATIDATDGLTATGVITVASLDTGTEARDNDLRSPNFFDVDEFPEILFHTTAAQIGADRTVVADGEITIKGVSAPLQLKGETGEPALDPWGHQRVGFDLTGTIDRRDFGLNWEQTLANGALVVAHSVKLFVNISAILDA